MMRALFAPPRHNRRRAHLRAATICSVSSPHHLPRVVCDLRGTGTWLCDADCGLTLSPPPVPPFPSPRSSAEPSIEPGLVPPTILPVANAPRIGLNRHRGWADVLDKHWASGGGGALSLDTRLGNPGATYIVSAWLLCPFTSVIFDQPRILRLTSGRRCDGPNTSQFRGMASRRWAGSLS